MFSCYLALICIIYLHLLSFSLSIISFGNTFLGAQPQTWRESVNANCIMDFYLRWKRSHSSVNCSGGMIQHSGPWRKNPDECLFFIHLFGFLTHLFLTYIQYGCMLGSELPTLKLVFHTDSSFLLNLICLSGGSDVSFWLKTINPHYNFNNYEKRGLRKNLKNKLTPYASSFLQIICPVVHIMSKCPPSLLP